MGRMVLMAEDNSLLLFVDVKDILNQKIKLDNTNSFDSIDTKREQVGNNIINNSRVLYNNIINNKIEEEFENRFHPIENIECNVSNENELVMHKVMLNRKTITDFSKYVIAKCDNIIDVNKELGEILNNVTRSYFEKQQQATTKTINFNGRKPRTFVLKRLEIIAVMIDSYDSVIFTKNELNQIISDGLDNPDERTSKEYYKCMIEYAKQQGGVIMGMYEMRFNMRGFSDTVKGIMNEKP